MSALCAASASERRVGHAFVVQYCGEPESYAAAMSVIRCPEIVTVSVRVPYRSLDDALSVPSRGPVAVGVAALLVGGRTRGLRFERRRSWWFGHVSRRHAPLPSRPACSEGPPLTWAGVPAFSVGIPCIVGNICADRPSVDGGPPIGQSRLRSARIQ
jgi:hypothetical protein